MAQYPKAESIGSIGSIIPGTFGGPGKLQKAKKIPEETTATARSILGGSQGPRDPRSMQGFCIQCILYIELPVLGSSPVSRYFNPYIYIYTYLYLCLYLSLCL